MAVLAEPGCSLTRRSAVRRFASVSLSLSAQVYHLPRSPLEAFLGESWTGLFLVFRISDWVFEALFVRAPMVREGGTATPDSSAAIR